jgi:hypothetical protein
MDIIPTYYTDSRVLPACCEHGFNPKKSYKNKLLDFNNEISSAAPLPLDKRKMVFLNKQRYIRLIAMLPVIAI